MKVFAIFTISATLLSSVFADLAPLIKGKGKIIEGSYLITLKGNTRTTLEAHVKSVEELFTDRRINKIETVFKHIGNAYHATLSENVIEKIRNLPEVDFVEHDMEVELKAIQTDAPWGISRISQRKFINNSTYTYNGDGSSVTVYVVDTGILITHPEFEGRARIGASFTNDNDRDEHGHGTHCAGVIGSKTYGVAKKVDIVSVKVFNSDGIGGNSRILKGINWAIGDKKGIKGNIMNISAGGGKSVSLNNAVEAAYQNGFVIVAAAGNENQDACNYSPASVPNAITVAASDINDNFTSFSNYGKCVDVIAPGLKIQSTWNNGTTAILTGTSIACPHVAGLAAYYLSKESLTNAQVREKIVKSATKNAIKNPKNGTPNLLAYNSIAK